MDWSSVPGSPVIAALFSAYLALAVACFLTYAAVIISERRNFWVAIRWVCR